MSYPSALLLQIPRQVGKKDLPVLDFRNLLGRAMKVESPVELMKSATQLQSDAALAVRLIAGCAFLEQVRAALADLSIDRDLKFFIETYEDGPGYDLQSLDAAESLASEVERRILEAGIPSEIYSGLTYQCRDDLDRTGGFVFRLNPYILNPKVSLLQALSEAAPGMVGGGQQEYPEELKIACEPTSTLRMSG